jgi:hypothetical protein
MKTWIIHVRPVGDGPPPEIRMRRLLKFALRSCGFRCTDIAYAATSSASADVPPTSVLSEPSTPQIASNAKGNL